MSLANILDEIKELKPLAEENVETGAPQTLNARRGRQRQAAERLKLLREEYIKSLLCSSVFIIVTGSASEDFAKNADANFPCFAGDIEGVYKDLADRVAPVLYENKECGANLFDVLSRHLEDKCMEMGLAEYNVLRFKEKYKRTIKNKEEFTKLIKDAINGEIGAELSGINVIRSITDKAIAKKHAANTTSIVLQTNDLQLIGELTEALRRITPYVFLVNAGEELKGLENTTLTTSVESGENKQIKTALTKIKNIMKGLQNETNNG